MYGPKPKRQITYVQKAPSFAHRWGADLRYRRKMNEEIALMKQDMELARQERARYQQYLKLCISMVMCRTSQGKVGVEYPVLKARLQDWVANYPTTNSEWQGIKRCLVTHDICHL